MTPVIRYLLCVVCLCYIITFATVMADEINHAIEKRMAFFEEQLRMQDIKIKQQERRILELEQKQLSLETEVRMQKDIIQTITRSKTTVENVTTKEVDEQLLLTNMTKKKVRPDKTVTRGVRQVERTAFTVYATKVIQNLGQGQPIKFDTVLTNLGNNYNIHTGVFTAPADGLYAFCFYIAEYHAHQLYASLVVDGQRTVQGIADGMHDAQDVQGGNFALLNLSAGQSVWLESDVSGGYIWASNNNRFESFSGFLLY